MTARMGADNAGDCLAQYMQVVDGAWYLPVTAMIGTTVQTNITTFDACVALCQDSCQFVTYDYRTLECFVRGAPTVVYEG